MMATAIIIKTSHAKRLIFMTTRPATRARVGQGSADVPGNVCIDEQQPSRIDKCDKDKNEHFSQRSLQ